MDMLIKRDWIEALRSGKYKQGTGRLHGADGSFCCLGVLCHVALYGDWTFSYKLNCWTIINKYGTLPRNLVDQIGVMAQDKLIRMNDSNVTFREIADWIEENIK